MKIVFNGSKDDLFDMIDKADFSPSLRAELTEAAAEMGLTFEGLFEQAIKEFFSTRDGE